MDVIIVGSLAIDVLHLPGDASPKVSIGGSCVYSAIACSKFNVKVGVVGAIGKDEEGSKIVSYLQRFPIDLKGIRILEGSTFSWEGRYFEDLNKRETLHLSLGVFADYVPVVPKEYHRPKVLFLANISPRLQREVIDATSPSFVVLDTMDHWIVEQREELEAVLKRVNVFVINEEEARLLGGSKYLYRAVSRIQEMMEGGLLIVKRGEYGAIVFSLDRTCFVPAFPLEVPIDPTGAGDSFAGAFIGSWIELGLRREEIAHAVYYATAVASFCVEGIGPARLGEVSRAEIEKRVDVLDSLICRRWESNPHVRKDTWS